MKNKMDYLKIVEALGDGVICVNEENKIEYMNKQAMQIIGISNFSCLGGRIDRCFNICTEESGSIILDIIEDVRVTHQTKGLEKDAYICGDWLKKTYVSASISYLELEHKKYVLITFREITKLKKNELQIRKDKQNLEKMMSGLPLGIVVVDKHRKVLDVNPYMVKNLSFGKVVTRSTLFGELMNCPNSKNSACGCSEACKNCEIKNSIDDILIRGKNCNSKQISFTHYLSRRKINKDYQVSFVDIPDDRGNKLMLILGDISEQVASRKKLEMAKEMAEMSNQLKTHFLTNMSHEICTPIHGVVGMIDLSNRSIKDHDLMENLKAIKTSSLRLLETLNNIIDISKIEVGEFELHYSDFSMRELLKEIYDENILKVNTKKIDFIVEPYEYPVDMFYSDRLRIKQALNHLVDNAIKFTKEGSIRIEHEIVDKMEICDLVIKIQDTGIGITPKFQKRMYESFTQEDDSLIRQYGGNGLGLAIARNIVSKLQGEIECVSIPGQGSTFTVRLQLVAGNPMRQKNAKMNPQKRAVVSSKASSNLEKKHAYSSENTTKQSKIRVNYDKDGYYAVRNIWSEHDYKIMGMRFLIEMMKISMSKQELDVVKEHAEELYQLIGAEGMDTLKHEALRVLMDVRKEKMDKVEQLLSEMDQKLDDKFNEPGEDKSYENSNC